MTYSVIEHILSLLPEHVLATKFETTKGLLFVPNDDMRKGPRYLIKINAPLAPTDIDWSIVSPFFNGGNEDVCRDFFGNCNGFSLGRQFTSWGILTQSPYTGELLDALNVPYDLRGNGYGSYPVHAPNTGYFIGALMINMEETAFTDIVLPDGSIVSGEFRKKPEVIEKFADVSSWIENRVPRALRNMEEMGMLGVQ